MPTPNPRIASTLPALLLAAGAALAACAAPDAPPVGVAASFLQCGAPAHGAPFLNDQPTCVLEGDPALGGCIGKALGVGDVNGDGRPDLIVGIASCNGLGPAGGRVAIFPGTPKFFSSQPIIADLDWQNPSPSTSSRGLAIGVGEVNGDGFADILVRGRYGAMVFAGGADLAAAIAAPIFRAPGSGTFVNADLADVDGDGLSDLVSVKASVASLFLATPGAPGQPFTPSRTFAAFQMSGHGDYNGDGAQDLLMWSDDGLEEVTALYAGCAPGSAGCDGGLSAAPLWTVPNLVSGLLPDQNGDGLREVLLAEPMSGFTYGRLWLHLSDPQTGGISPTPVWSAIADPVFNYLGTEIIFPGDLDRRGSTHEFVMPAIGRIYGFFPPPQGVSAELQPAYAWPSSDTLVDLYGGQAPLTVRAAGDLDGDHYDDLVVGNGYSFDEPGLGRVFVLRGGKVPPPAFGDPPYLPEPQTCGLALSAGGLPDLTVDRDAIARSLMVRSKDVPADSCELAEGCVDAPGLRRLLRFTVSIANLGGGAAIIPGPEEAPELYYYDACHFHDHLTGFASYELRDPSGTLTATGRKQGFYMVDLVPYCMDAQASVDRYPAQGISPGWADVYSNDLPCQWLDITDVPDGTYTLRISANDNGVVVEDDVLPNFAEVTVHIQGDEVTVID